MSEPGAPDSVGGARGVRQTEGYALPQNGHQICRIVLGRSAHLRVESVYRDRSGANVESRLPFRCFVAGNAKSVRGKRRFSDTHRQLAEVAEPHSEGPTFGGSNFRKRFSRFRSAAFIGGLVVLRNCPICVRLPMPLVRWPTNLQAHNGGQKRYEPRGHAAVGGCRGCGPTTPMPKAVRARAASSGVLGRQFEHPLETAGRIHYQKTGLWCFDAEGVRDPARERNERALFSRMILASNMERHCALQHIKPLVLILVTVKGRLLTRAHQNFGNSDSRAGCLQSDRGCEPYHWPPVTGRQGVGANRFYLGCDSWILSSITLSHYDTLVS